MLIVTGYVHVEPSDVDAFAADIQALARITRQRNGSLSYGVAVDDPLAGRLLVVERWRDQAALAWFKKCHFQVTPEIDRALMIKGFLVLGVTLI